MATDRNTLAAQANLFNLSSNLYPGRGIVAGLDETGANLVQVYWVMGRSENSRNRVFKGDPNTGRLYTEAADPSKMKDSSLIIYNAMREYAGFLVVSNGDQTDTVIEKLRESPQVNCYPQAALSSRQYEPDAPNFTQRITAVSSVWKNQHQGTGFSILRKSRFGTGCDNLAYEYPCIRPGFGFCITTYAGDGNPLPPFYGDPLLMPLTGSIKDIAETYWKALNEENRVSLAVKFFEMANGHVDFHIINKYQQVQVG